MECARNNNSGRGRGRRTNYEDQGGGRGRGGAQNQGSGGGRGSSYGPPARQQTQHGINRPSPPENQPQSAWGNRPPQQPQPPSGRGSTWAARLLGQSSSTPPTTQPSHPSPAPVELGVQSLTISKKQPSSSRSKEGQNQAMRRPDRGGTLAVRSINLQVNHFPVSFDKQGTFFHYDVDVRPVASNGSRRPTKPLGKSEMRLIKDFRFPGAEFLTTTAYDGEKNVFSAIKLPEGQFTVTVPEGEDVRSGQYVFTIKLVNELKPSKLDDYLRGSLPHVPRDILQGLDLVMKENPMRKTIPLGNRSFFSARNSTDLRGGLVAYKGFQSSLKLTEQGLASCLDYSILAFRKPLPVLDFLEQHFELERNDVIRMRTEVNNALRGLKVKVNHRPTNQKFTVAGLTDQVARDIYFDLVDREGNAPPQNISLVAYFRDKWGKNIRYLDFPCLNLGKPGKPNAVPIEFCELVEGQRFPKEELLKEDAVFLKKLTLVKPGERSRTISDMIHADDGPYGEVARNFGITLDRNMTKVVGRVIGAPVLKVGGARPVRVDAEKCQWNLLGKSFVEPKSVDRWALLDFTEGDRNRLNVGAFINSLRGRCKNLDIQMAEPVVYRLKRMNELASVSRLEKLFIDVVNEAKKKSKGKLQMIVCAMTGEDPGYKNLKWVSEIKIGVVTQCFLAPNANKQQDQYLANLCLKINAKLGGTNFEVAGQLLPFNPAEHVMFIGADVNHSASRDKESPSIAAVVGTVNWPAANRYAARVSPQKHRCETIKNFGEMCLELVGAYAQINKVRPKRIVLFRDGVSDGQFEMVLGEELRNLKETICTEEYNPQITVIVAQKRHQTRLFAENRNDVGQTGNVPPGTVVDTKIIHPFDFDFYLCSHYGGIGTSKPTHYYVLWDENGFTSDQLQKLIYDMCFTYVRCTKPVSLVPPVYYADLVAYRGRMYQEVAMVMDPGESTSSTPSFDQSFYKLHSDLENTMFFV